MGPSFSTTAIRYVVGGVFVLVGFLKWFSEEFGLMKFERIGMPFPEVTVLVVGSVELICGSLLLFNLHVRKAVIPLLIVMAGAIGLTKVPLLVRSGFWTFAFEARLDIVLTALLLVLWKENKIVPRTGHPHGDRR
ncbi:hypothetical protein BSNK01_20380 [Bacillaceae bacterium]